MCAAELRPFVPFVDIRPQNNQNKACRAQSKHEPRFSASEEKEKFAAFFGLTCDVCGDQAFGKFADSQTKKAAGPVGVDQRRVTSRGTGRAGGRLLLPRPCPTRLRGGLSGPRRAVTPGPWAGAGRRGVSASGVASAMKMEGHGACFIGCATRCVLTKKGTEDHRVQLVCCLSSQKSMEGEGSLPFRWEPVL